jgi:hypothetical protein
MAGKYGMPGCRETTRYRARDVGIRRDAEQWELAVDAEGGATRDAGRRCDAEQQELAVDAEGGVAGDGGARARPTVEARCQ